MRGQASHSIQARPEEPFFSKLLWAMSHKNASREPGGLPRGTPITAVVIAPISFFHGQREDQTSESDAVGTFDLSGRERARASPFCRLFEKGGIRPPSFLVRPSLPNISLEQAGQAQTEGIKA